MIRPLLTLALLLIAPAAQALECGGTRLFQALERDDPALAASIRAEADSIANGDGLVWRVTDPRRPDRAPLTLFGTMHMSDPRLLDLPAPARTAFDGAQRLVLEVTEILDPARLAALGFRLASRMSYTDGTTLDARLPADAIGEVKAAAQAAGLPWSVAGRMKPWALMGQIALPACERARKAAGRPFLDIALGRQAQARGLDVRALETMEGQMSVLDALPEEAMVQGLVETVRLGARIEDVFETMIALYDEERIGLVWTILNHYGPKGFLDPAEAARERSGGYAEFQRLVVDERNVAMAGGVEAVMDDRATFVAVGALHLPGETGLVRLLRARGYTVERLTD